MKDASQLIQTVVLKWEVTSCITNLEFLDSLLFHLLKKKDVAILAKSWILAKDFTNGMG